jgi:MHS family proline/betaine transporter-like MFS transporter
VKLEFFTALLINAGMLTFSSAILPFFGKLGDKYGIKKLIIISSIATIILPYFMFYYANKHDLLTTLLFEIIITLFLTLNYALLPALITSLFPTPVRYTGVGIAYNLSNATFGGLSPYLCLKLIKLTGTNLAPAFYFSFLGVISLLPFIFFKDRALHDS